MTSRPAAMTPPGKPLDPSHVTSRDADTLDLPNPGDPGVVVPPPGEHVPRDPREDLPFPDEAPLH